MTQPMFRIVALTAAALLAFGAGTAEAARYDYGRMGGQSTERGFYIFLEGGLANPRNADVVVATSELIEDFGGGTNSLRQILPVWNDDFAGRFALGYQWANGNKLQGTVWNYDGDQSAAGDGLTGGRLHYAVGPPIYTGGEYVGTFGTPGYYEMTTKISAQTADLAWAREQEVSEAFRMELSVGLRWATFEETMEGFYDNVASVDPEFGLVRYEATKSNEGDMIGARIAARGTYRFARQFSISSSLGFSYLDGELKASSLLSPTGTENAPIEPSGFAGVTDDGRSGDILDFDLVFGWHNSNDWLRFWLGWEQAVWNDIAADLVRNFPGTTAPLRERDSVTFSSYKLGVYVRF